MASSIGWKEGRKEKEERRSATRFETRPFSIKRRSGTRLTGVEDLVVEDGEVEGESESDGVGRRKLGDGDIGGSLVSLEGLVGGVLALVSSSELGEVSVVVSHPGVVEEEGRRSEVSEGRERGEGKSRRREKENEHLVVEDLGLSRGSGRDEVLVENLTKASKDKK